MTHWKTQFNYDYLGAYSLPDGKDIILTIRETKKEQVVGTSGKKEECFVAYFFENVKPMILNRTNCCLLYTSVRSTSPFILFSIVTALYICHPISNVTRNDKIPTITPI